MPEAGGFCAEKDGGGLGYGMFWRKELNWRVMTFEYQHDTVEEGSVQAVEMDSFHA